MACTATVCLKPGHSTTIFIIEAKVEDGALCCCATHHYCHRSQAPTDCAKVQPSSYCNLSWCLSKIMTVFRPYFRHSERMICVERSAPWEWPFVHNPTHRSAQPQCCCQSPATSHGTIYMSSSKAGHFKFATFQQSERFNGPLSKRPLAAHWRKPSGINELVASFPRLDTHSHRH
jgi:hypothetical protein